MKSKPGTSSVPNKHIYSRVSYLYQVATFLDKTHRQSGESKETTESAVPAPKAARLGSGISRHLISQVYGVPLKAQIRLSSSIKHATCKRCHNIFEEGSTLHSFVENRSKGGKKPWADVLVHECTQCGLIRRFPVGAKRQSRRSNRETNEAAGSSEIQDTRTLS